VHLTQFPAVDAAWADEKLVIPEDPDCGARRDLQGPGDGTEEQVIGHPLDAAVTVTGPGKIVELLSKYEEDMRAFCIISGFRVQKGGS